MDRTNGNINPKYQYIGFLPKSVRIKENGFWGINDFEGNEILPSNFIEVFTLASSFGLIAARDAGFWDIYDYYGNKINTERFDKVYPFYGLFGMSKIKIGSSWGILNKFGRIIVPAEYKKIEKFGKGIQLQKSNGECDFYDRKELMKLTTAKNAKYTSDLKKPFKKIISLNTKAIKNNLN